MMWDPGVIEELTDEELQYYQDFACCAAIPGNGTNKEYALHLLYICKGNVKKAILRLMQGTALIPENHTLKSYKYQEEIEAYHQALIKCDKDFFSIAKELGTKSVKQCVQFYYLWKKVCTDEYRKLRQVRRKREQDELYNLRSRASGTQGAADPSSENQESHSPKADEECDHNAVFKCDYPGCRATYTSKQALNGHLHIHGGHAQDSGHYGPGFRSVSPSPGPPSNLSTHSEDVEEGNFPCKLCDRVFTKVKSRNAHMKSHRQTDADHRPSYFPSDDC
ncbi:hypothetical protein LSH36_96g02011 [Paralvinella palmiformis]|uniref:Uncharacterized protein n=1 Tax=Paralvinella palmiformis TaxID=53620 RepID=A0AAD9K0A3_9ANNE|nr:hypothetical protein LSH36_96g02011 [Paralvinella palmiformis]